MTTVRFRRRYDWALLPFKQRIDTDAAKEEATIYAKEFRWLRAYRRPELCWPWRLAQELGWVIPSPVHVNLSPISDEEVEIPAGNPSALTDLSSATGYTEFWARASSLLATHRSAWLRFHQFRVGDHWECMFVLNGAGAVEWHLGWTVEIPTGMFVLLLPYDTTIPVEVPMGVLTDDAVARLNAGHGLSVAIRPRAPVEVHRGQPIARILLLDAATIKARSDDGEPLR